MYYNSWSTQNEITYIDGLLTGKWTGRQPETPKKLLRSYIRGARYRILHKTWGMVNGKAVLEYAISRLDNAV